VVCENDLPGLTASDGGETSELQVNLAFT
jgi:hypothetical protein